MANSGFNVGQTGNATEVGAGVVKLATQAQVDAGQADDGGVPLVATPDKLPKGNQVTGLIAGEAITAGQAVAQVFEEYAEILPPLVDELTETGSVSFPNNSTWYAQEFTTSADVDRLKKIIMRFQNATGVTGTTFGIKIRLLADLNGGPDVVSYNTTTFNGSGTTLTVTLDNRQLPLLPNTTYVILCRFNINGYANANVKTDNTYSATMYSSSDNAVTFSPSGIDSFYLQLTEEELTVNENEIVLANALTMADNVNTRINFIGFAKETVTAGQPVEIDFSTIVKPIGASLTPGSLYYLSDTPGAISTTPGTISRRIGYAQDAETIIRARGPVSPVIGYSSSKAVVDGISYRRGESTSGAPLIKIYDYEGPTIL